MFHAMEQTTTERTASLVRAELARRKLRGSSFAPVLGMSRTTLWRRLSGHIPFSLEELTALAEHLDVPVTSFIPERASAA